ncbi:alpha-ketoacid dehydrogenase subunit beta [Coxiella burnetii]|uniref:2-oxoisovalerate dehydrogenase subunit beta n=2 Tax=Coxiella burnetii TaxID=777 RepID=Q83DQ7_COXBU|nr:alpha-ketoacid dehydrogenase subunit beta [Coxiella burnetii]NP_819669.1 pyruvate dehydrogenase E1 component subunit beta [Coxiella burnetii RSA 493]AAO90183.1 pyruvate dehydrogenase E1 component beta subunit [Coxiella burnetii RSA 493]ABS78274.1 pyruvate dehydrogenase E1 component beta subunit [Coxiella burnetii Dugway 5J108-111]ACJ18671.1 pyruvate dehydrogenase E1 component beta subunit [Coxiella burnetii CbuG_Q212]ACJ20768.1 pyruvate dehydrogenase E1 component beta subunit [Coxiella burn
MDKITLVEAVNQALSYEMAKDDSVIVLGEDVGINGGVFRATVGLVEKFGPQRVLDTPLAESMIAGISVGMAAQGLKPVAEFQFEGFIYSGLDHILSHAARLRNRTRGRLHCPIVYRAPFGGGIHAPEHHSESMEALFAHIPGVRVVIPSSPARAYGLLLASIRNPDPVLFFEPKRIYRLVKQKVPNDGKALPLDQCFLLREGGDITLVTWGAMIKETLEAAEQLKEQGIEAEVIDVATIKPIDMDTILQSVEKTGRCVIIHEAPLTGGVGAEIAAGIAEHGLLSLIAPVKRVAGYDTIMPYFKLEKKYMPSADRIIKTVQSLMEFS